MLQQIYKMVQNVQKLQVSDFEILPLLSVCGSKHVNMYIAHVTVLPRVLYETALKYLRAILKHLPSSSSVVDNSDLCAVF